MTVFTSIYCLKLQFHCSFVNSTLHPPFGPALYVRCVDFQPQKPNTFAWSTPQSNAQKPTTEMCTRAHHRASLCYRYKYSKFTLRLSSTQRRPEPHATPAAGKCVRLVSVDANGGYFLFCPLTALAIRIHFVRQHNNDWQTNNSLMTMQLFVMWIHRWFSMECLLCVVWCVL